ncbi:GIY-YIG nuclease family protein [Kineococcus terrestris]|uniref:GIY-YIG nuclease family protein n=1 Tax=Kineococcus terrestris TaxID=2044856 RepID=UPI0034DB4AD2
MLQTIAQYGGEPGPTDAGTFIVDFLTMHGPQRRATMVRAFEETWQQIAGRPLRTNAVSKVKKAIEQLLEQGRIVSTPARGVYAVVDTDASSDEAASMPLPALVPVPNAEDVEDVEDVMPDSVERLGEGAETVYCCYFDIYRRHAELGGDTRWPVKIGRTALTVESRTGNARTFMPERPVTALLLRTPRAGALEKVLHGVLELRGRRFASGGGAEWFLTTPEEIADIYRAVMAEEGRNTKPS